MVGKYIGITILFFFVGAQILASEKSKQAFDEYYDSAHQLQNQNLPHAIKLAETAKSIAVEGEYDFGVAKSCFLLGYLEEKRSKLDKAAIYYFECIRHLTDNSIDNYHYYKIASHLNIGRIFHEHHQYDQAIEYYSKGLDVAHLANEDKFVAWLNYSKARSYKESGDYLNALEALFQAAKYAESSDDNLRLVKVNQQLGLVFKRIGEYEKSRNHYFKIFEYKDEVPNFNKYAWTTCHNIGETFLLEGNTKKAQEFFHQAIEYAKKYGDESISFITYMDLGEIYLTNNSFQQAEQNYMTALKFNIDLASDPNKFKIYKQLSTLYGFLGDAKKFAEYNTKYTECLEKHLKTSEELAQMDQQYNIQLVTQRYFELVESQKRMAALKKYGGFAVAGILSFILVFLIVSRIRKTRLKKSLEQELKEAMQGLDFDL